MAKFYNSTKDLPLKLIPFVTPSEERVTITSESRSLISTTLTGKEISQFYDSVVSTPTMETCKDYFKYSKKKPLKNKKDLQSPAVNFKSDSIFRFAQERNINKIQQCISAGYSIDQQDRYGWTPLMCATCEGHSEVVEYLLKQGANPNIRCKQGMTPLDIALKKNNSVIIKFFQTGLESDKTPPTEQLVEEKQCKSCKMNYNEPTIAHERSIVHLFNAKKPELSTFYHIPENNKGFQIMLKSGWDKNKGLGLNAEGRKFPIKTVLKKDRACIGKYKEVAKVTHFSANDKSAVKTVKPLSVKTVREKTLKKWERKKIEEKTRRKEIKFRREFYSN